MQRHMILISTLFVAIAAIWLVRHRRTPLPDAYVSERTATLWSSPAQVREQVATLRYGERVAVVQRRGEQVNVRTPEDITGWVEARLLMEPTLWQRSVQLLSQARSMPVQASGRTKVRTNLRVEPGRNGARLYQFDQGNPVEVLGRTVAEFSAPGEEAQGSRESGEQEKTRREDWFLVRGQASAVAGPAGAFEAGTGRREEASLAEKTGESVPVAGWVLARFIELELPGPVRDLASSSGMRVIAWFELNRVAVPGGEKPQYLAAGVHGGEGQACDFTSMRVYTWGERRHRYETAYVESKLCGRLPIRVWKGAAGDPEFRFAEMDGPRNEERHYVMRLTTVRRVREGERAPGKPAGKPHGSAR